MAYVFNFGRYKGRSIKAVSFVYPAYIIWAASNVMNHGIKPKTVKRAQALLVQRQSDGVDLVARPPAMFNDEPNTVYYADGSGYREASGPAGPLYFDKFGNT